MKANLVVDNLNILLRIETDAHPDGRASILKRIIPYIHDYLNTCKWNESEIFARISGHLIECRDKQYKRWIIRRFKINKPHIRPSKKGKFTGFQIRPFNQEIDEDVEYFYLITRNGVRVYNKSKLIGAYNYRYKIRNKGGSDGTERKRSVCRGSQSLFHGEIAR